MRKETNFNSAVSSACPSFCIIVKGFKDGNVEKEFYTFIRPMTMQGQLRKMQQYIGHGRYNLALHCPTLYIKSFGNTHVFR